MDLTEATSQLQQDTGIAAQPAAATLVGGGSFGRVYRVPSADGLLFAKLNHAANFDSLAAESDGLNALRIVLACYEANETGRRVVMT